MTLTAGDGSGAGPGHDDPDVTHDVETIPARHAAMIDAASTMKPARSRQFPLERVLLTAGGICVPIGVVAIIIGWYGASHTGWVFQQNPYLISGGLLGLGIIFIGCFFYFGYWMTRQVRVLTRIEIEVRNLAAATAASAAAAGAPSRNGNGWHPPAEAKPPVTLVATQRGTLLHRPDCPVVINKSNLRAVDADTPGLRPCQVCFPLDEA